MATCKCGYSRRTHLIGLNSALITYVVLIVALFITKDDRYCIAGSWLIVILICIVFWWLRGFHKWFPLFHFITLCVEFVYHCLPLVTLTYWSTIYVRLLLDGINVWLMVVTVTVALLVLEHAVLVYKTLAVPYVLLRGSVAQKAELATQVVSNAVVNLPGATAIQSQA